MGFGQVLLRNDGSEPKKLQYREKDNAFEEALHWVGEKIVRQEITKAIPNITSGWLEFNF